MLYHELKNIFYHILGTKCMGRLKDFKVNLPFLKKMKFSKAYDENTFYFVISPYTKHPGLSDRLKAIVTCYNLAKKYGYNFKIVFKQPFALEDFLVPNKVDWIADFNDLHYSIGHTKFFSERKILDGDSWKHVRLTPGKEYHCYNYVGNWEPRIYPDTGLAWSELYHELFKPCGELEELLDSFPYKEKAYIAVHLRFVNALDNFEEPSCYNNPLPDEQSKRNLIERCKEGIMEIKRRNGNCDVLVFSDSKRFLDELNDIPVHTLGGSEHIAHLSFTNDRLETMKTFVDLYMLSKARKVYRIDAPEIYAYSKFAHSGALIGNIDFETFKV